ncbi:MAG: hypothetical protein PWP07_128 [Epulopiscium sp.]|uniref:DUF2922 family protein n=1 Tax=Defluviitalea raffinosedens TaxID=1450156 RepID=A0A7C8LIY4_9FIRM|nr:DUF2922 domain-containing protein [Defluviitalea raffinosedens]MBZ4666919.1 hypothetical protein [Defluviitaleaceae bacterium]MDK2786903.1 hypothetical protein [Candidatus Epulonipiscium sp.]KAE9636138.1 DUF2922 family protein [Defluviitalea raffinosedens]MBM7685009.1 hypothetical protein [Defluviitalea raffinosedens]HHW67526.1 DUF2922 domain-containing protein [Candidatus Epulonipiscium sp.]
MEKKTLQMVFTTQGGSTMTISVNDPKSNLTDNEVKSAMEELITLGVFTSSTGDPIAKKSAQIITQTTQELSLA